MLPDQRLFERYAMEAERILVNTEAGNGASIAKIGAAFNLSKEESHYYAKLLIDQGWAVPVSTSFDDFSIRLTMPGHTAIQKLKLTPFQRWWDGNHDPIVAGIVGAVLGGIISGLIILAVAKIWQ